MRKRLCLTLLTLLLAFAFSGCEQDPPADGTTAPDPVWESIKERNREGARRRAEFQESELHEYTLNYMRGLFAELFPEKNIDEYEILVTKEQPTDEEIAPLDGDTERAFELMRTANFIISIMHPDLYTSLTKDERDTFMQALGDRKFTVELNAGYYEYNYIVDGEVHIEPKPMY